MTTRHAARRPTTRHALNEPGPRRFAALAALAVCASAAGLAGCATATMDVPADLASVERMPVEGRSGWRASQRAAFGAWEATDVDRSWTKGSGWRIGVGAIGGGSDRARQEYAFRFLEDGAEVASVGCLAVGSRGTGTTSVVDVTLGAREALECQAQPDASAGAVEPAWDLVLEANRDRHLEGFLRIGEDRYAVVSTGPGGRFTPAQAYGFEIRDGERVIAAVETVNEGAVMLAPELVGERRTVVAAAAAALLLYERVESDD